MPKIFLLKKLSPDDPIGKRIPEDGFVRWVGKSEEEASRNAARGSPPRDKVSMAQQGAIFL
jgi:hypothetical protein